MLQDRWRTLRWPHPCQRCGLELRGGELARYQVWVLRDGREFGYGYSCWRCNDCE